MEKEQKKLLLVAVSVGVFLLVTITVAIILLNQKTQPQEAAMSWTAPQPVQVQPISPSPVETDGITDNETNDEDLFVIQIPSPTEPGVPENPEVVTVTTPLPAQPTTPPATAPKTTQAKPPVQPAKTAAAKTKTVNDYWIQTGAFSARVRAEDAKDTLAEKGLISIIENREINGQVWYRVRIGPYTSQKEADYWLSLVKSIDGFGESQVRQTTRTQ